MSSQRHPHSTWQLFTFAVLLLFCGGAWHAAFGQCFPGQPCPTAISRITRAPNPPAYIKPFTGKRLDNRVKQASGNSTQASPATSADAKQQDIEQAIAEGNQARDKNDYKQALDHYQKIAKDLNPKEARAFYGMGNLYSDLYCYDSAIESYRNALDLKKDYLDALIGLGYAYINKERYDEAEKQFQTAHNLELNNIDANLGLARVYAKKGKYQDAITQINLVINAPATQSKDRATAYLALGLIYQDQSKWQDAIAQFEKAMSFNPDLAIAYLQLGLSQLVVASSEFSNLSLQEVRIQDTVSLSASARQAGQNIQLGIEHGYKHPYAYLALGNALIYQSNYQGAESSFNKYLAEVQKLEDQLSLVNKDITTRCDSGFSYFDAIGYWYLGFMCLRESSFETDDRRKTELLNAAIKNLEQAIKAKPDFATAHGTLASVYDTQGRYEDAIEQYKQALNYETKDSAKATAYGGLGFAYYFIGPDNEAIRNLNKAIELDPGNSSFYPILSSIYERQGNFDEAIVQQKKAMEHESQVTAHSYFFLASIYYQKALKKGSEEDYAEAIRLSKKALEINDAYAEVYFLLGQIYKFYKEGAMVDEAIANYEKAAGYHPKDPAIYFHMADLYFARKHNDEAAIEYLNKAISLKPDYGEAYEYLGSIYHHKKDDTEAIAQLMNAIKYNPKYLPAYLDLADIYKAQKNYPEAIKYLMAATNLAPKDYYPYKELAKIYEAQQNNEDAIHYYEEAMSRLAADDLSTKNLYLGRIERLRGHYAEAITYFQKVNFPDEPGQTSYEVGIVYVVSKNKKAALEQYQQLVQLKSPLAEELLAKIKEMK